MPVGNHLPTPLPLSSCGAQAQGVHGARTGQCAIILFAFICGWRVVIQWATMKAYAENVHCAPSLGHN